MSKNTIKKLTFDDIIAKKMAKDAKLNETIDIEVPSMGGMLTFNYPSEDIKMETMDILGEKTEKEGLRACDYIIYNCCPMLKNPELHKQMECLDPKEIVSKFLDIEERVEIGQKLFKFSGLMKMSEEVKN